VCLIMVEWNSDVVRRAYVCLIMVEWNSYVVRRSWN